MSREIRNPSVAQIVAAHVLLWIWPTAWALRVTKAYPFEESR